MMKRNMRGRMKEGIIGRNDVVNKESWGRQHIENRTDVTGIDYDYENTAHETNIQDTFF